MSRRSSSRRRRPPSRAPDIPARPSLPPARSLDGLRRAAGDPARAAQAASFLNAALAPATARAYAVDWQAFTRWCAAEGVSPIDCPVEAVALHLSDFAAGHATATLTRRRSAIARIRRQIGRPLADPAGLLRDMIRGIARRQGRPAQSKAALTAVPLRAILAGLPDSRAGRRDRALLLLGYAGALRRSELVGLDVADVAIGPEGLRLTVTGGKSDPERRGDPVFIDRSADPAVCPVRATQAWIRCAGLRAGPLFRKVTKGDRIGTRRLHPDSVRRIVQRQVRRWAAGDGLSETEAADVAARFGGHSLRRGLASELAGKGAPDALIRQQTRHRDMRALSRYAAMTPDGRARIRQLRGL